ncbi:MAG TPA: (d)CMP kinase [Actinomycetota bacterium]|nr:(d)CMP kinase [Actinomycetota bacterium]
MKGPVVAIDGPAGSGKSTAGRAIADALGIPFIETGSMYRALALAALRSETKLDDERALVSLIDDAKLEFSGGGARIEGEDVSHLLRMPEVSAAASAIAVHPEVRAEMVKMQRTLVPESGAVVEGRDIGTVVLPDADVKVFLTASHEERAARRTNEETPGGSVETPEQIQLRDRTDSERAASPLVPAEDAIVIDSTSVPVDEIVKRILELCRSGLPS